MVKFGPNGGFGRREQKIGHDRGILRSSSARCPARRAHRASALPPRPPRRTAPRSPAEGEPVQLVTFRVEAIGLVRKATLKAEPLAGEDATHAIREHRYAWIAEEERSVSCPVYERDRLKVGNNFVGPAIVEQMDATTLILPAMTARVDVFSNLILEPA